MSSLSTRLFPNELPHENLLDRGLRVAAWWSDLPTAKRWKNSRVGTLCHRVEACRERGVVAPGNANYKDLQLALRELNELWFIVLQIGDGVEDPVYREAFGRLLKDPLHPGEPSKHTPGRDAQWELLVASVAVRGGLKVSRPPAADQKQVDYLVSTPRRTVAVECKRIRSVSRLRDDVADARDQIRVSGMPGWLVADLTLATDDGAYIKALDRYVPDDVVRRGQIECGNRFAKDHIKMLVETCGDTDVAYFQWHDCVLRPAAVHEDGREEPWCTFGFWNALPLKPEDSPSRAAVDEIKTVFDAALPQL